MGKIVGIDFGTTFTRIAVVRSGKADLIPIQNGSRLLPSLVLYSPSQAIVVGEKAKECQFLYPKSSVLHIKRYLGQNIHFNLNGRIFSAEELASHLFKELKYKSEMFLGEKLGQAVITVPAYFNHFQREGIKTAAEMGGFEVIQLLNEPTAASLTYGFDPKIDSEKMMICDLGGGTFDISILEKNKTTCRVRGTSGDAHLGGMEWDRTLYRFFEHKIFQQFGKKALSTAFIRNKLWKNCEKLKEALSSERQALLSTPILIENKSYLKNFTYEMTRQEFAHITRYLVESLAIPLKRVLADARLSSENLDRVILVGGATLIPQVRYFLENFLIKPLYTEVDPQKVVALGAALRASQIEQCLTGETLQEVTPLSLSLKMNKNLSVRLIKKNTPIPACESNIFTLTKNDQADAEIYIYQGEHEVMKNDHLVGKVSLKDIFLKSGKDAQIKITCLIDINGMISVSVKELETNEEQKVTLKNIKAISYQKIISILDKSKSCLLETARHKSTHELRLQINELIGISEKFLENFQHKLHAQLKEKIQAMVETLKQSMNGSSFEGLQDGILALCEAISLAYPHESQDDTLSGSF